MEPKVTVLHPFLSFSEDPWQLFPLQERKLQSPSWLTLWPPHGDAGARRAAPFDGVALVAAGALVDDTV
ncbi:hypothetical protein PG993_004434 [Apiospora rasikravindrae]|uniref:Uncharacterized protein n=1 Tax=Apiospora rasikravindrae TaxID=990691 RepID=A0ABR1TCR1_9PEZI